MNEILLQLDAISYNHPDGLGLHNINLTINKGDRIAVVGGNGSGKSTLAKIISQRLTPTSGVISGICSNPENIGTVTDLRYFNSEETVSSALQAICGGDPANTISNVNLDPMILQRRIGRLSGGESYRVALAAQLQNKAPILLLDAPSSMLDARSANSLVEALADREEALVVFTADITVAIETCQTAVLLNQGEIVAVGQTIEILTDSELLKQHGVDMPSALSPSWLRRRARSQNFQGVISIEDFDQGERSAKDIAEQVAKFFNQFRSDFLEVTQRAQENFARREFAQHQINSQIRLLLHRQLVNQCVEVISPALDNLKDQAKRELWASARHIFAQAIAWRSDSELAETFFNSVTRRLFTLVGFDDDLEFRWFGGIALPVVDPGQGEVLTFRLRTTSSKLIQAVLEAFDVGQKWVNLERDSSNIALAIEKHLSETWEATMPVEIDVLKPVFYRNRGAYLVGRIRYLTRVSPLIIPLRSTEEGIVCDAVLLTENLTSRIFGFTRSYFHVNTKEPGAIVAFIKTLIPLKPVAELYTAIGYSAHGKTSLFRAIYRHLSNSTDRFEPARGIPGMVMTVFTLPSFGVVFKVIKDIFPPSKKITRSQVMDKYKMVFAHDRVGRMVDAQVFEDLAFPRERFSEDLLQELASEASRSITITDTDVIIHHLYTERRVYPLDLYLQEMPENLVLSATLDYGHAIKDLCAANIFPGDLFTKNFGVTRHGSVVFYDYDELTLLQDVTFREIPEARSFEDEMSSQPWFAVGANDVFPEEFRKFFRFPDSVGNSFDIAHGDLCDPETWVEMQRQHEVEAPEFFPYPEEVRLNITKFD
ncbi:MAG: bifunctional isocitrate dehydrogenase kinase/phosphatase [Acidimicrobiaceae bacterium]|nr:bifunctional isocitrate dehydrogenase kinase/phosphatase [Acidimicrobiaceae bacterium]